MDDIRYTAWSTAIIKRLKQDFRHVTYEKMTEDRYSRNILEVGWDNKNHMKITVEHRNQFSTRDVEMFRDCCLILYYRKRPLIEHIYNYEQH